MVWTVFLTYNFQMITIRNAHAVEGMHYGLWTFCYFKGCCCHCHTIYILTVFSRILKIPKYKKKKLIQRTTIKPQIMKNLHFFYLQVFVYQIIQSALRVLVTYLNNYRYIRLLKCCTRIIVITQGVKVSGLCVYFFLL